MKDVYPEFADRVDFYAIGESSFESIEMLESFRKKEGYPWPVAEIDPGALQTLRVLQRSTKIALDHQGIISYRAGYSSGGASEWRQVFQDLAERAGG